MVNFVKFLLIQHFFLIFCSSISRELLFRPLSSLFVFMGTPFGPFWSVKCLNFGGESCQIRIFSCSIQEIYILRKVKNQVLLFQSSREPNLSDLIYIYIYYIYFKGFQTKKTLFGNLWSITTLFYWALFMKRFY